jgi:hypothetical protein
MRRLPTADYILYPLPWWEGKIVGGITRDNLPNSPSNTYFQQVSSRQLYPPAKGFRFPLL